MGGHQKNIPVNIQKRLTKFFVSNLPVRCSGNDLAGFVRAHAEIYDICIARKRDKMGNRFGFVSLLDVKNTGEMEKVLSNIRMGYYKLSFNVARFILEEGEINNRQTEKIKPKIVTGIGGNAKGMETIGDTRVGMRSFKDAFLGRPTEEQRGKVIVVNDEFKANEHVLGKVVIVAMADFKALQEASETIKGMMLGERVVQYVGGMFILVSFKNSEDVERFSVLSKEKRDVFRSMEKWAGQSLPFERIAWLRVQGIPLHLLDNYVINRIGESFGKIVQVGQHGVWDSDLSYDYVGVLVTEGKRIQEEVVMQWKGRRYRVWVEEEIGDWEPDFLGKDRGVEGAPVNRSQSAVTENPASNNPYGFMECTEFSVGNNGNKESSQTIHIENNANMGDPNYGEAVVVDK
ncbi:putative RNA-binding domain superfamily [Helianthus annuus]|uniref:RNA-binding domain superfamily n=1 Tax=Helianthus annuus TaxID=4232 RepID=A0A9K3IMX4_HELAN|nr:putative RNA-binding domain superfamily [Helianthus annuus]KAJ0550749.1 putative RNA-binding domain superfamily [Helianthus annuus]KAJ0557583.1 putative RNA-binding domain superfamily [Helianthus annuus]KAJ0563716.1 putative RNA-binding domain superfamily [Helianthus annuus]KAJ0729048.1 putative RNA-binding domain superfamily [Helianthus annuus]